MACNKPTHGGFRSAGKAGEGRSARSATQRHALATGIGRRPVERTHERWPMPVAILTIKAVSYVGFSAIAEFATSTITFTSKDRLS